jgi:outer membrane receptor for ferrienterochelin and colicin
MKRNILVIILLFVFQLIFAGTTGKLAGKITDENNKTIPFANIQITELQLGIQADKNGNFIMRNIPPGVYEITCSQISFQTHKIKGVKIVSDESTILNISLVKSAEEIDGIQISEARNKVVDRLKTSSGKVVTQGIVKYLKIQNIEDIIALQAGTFVLDGKLHIRGGKVNEVVYMIDGIPMNNIVDGTAALAIDVDAIKEMKVMTGGFPAEYGNAQSGIINIITEDGGIDWHGKIELISDHMIVGENQNSDQFKISASGPLTSIKGWNDRSNFFFNISNLNHDSEFKNEYGANPYDELIFLDPIWQDYDYYDPTGDRDEFIGFEIDQRQFNYSNGSLKLTFKPSKLQKMSLALRAETNVWQPYNHSWRYALEHYKVVDEYKDQFAFSYENVIKPNMIVKFSASIFQNDHNEKPRKISKDSFFETDSLNFDLHNENLVGNTPGITYNNEYGFAGDLLYPVNWKYLTPQTNEYTYIEEFLAPGSIYNEFVENKYSNTIFVMDFEWQYNRIHDLKTGVNFVQYKLKNYKYSTPWELDANRYKEYLTKFATPQDSTFISFNNQYHFHYALEDIYSATLAASGETYGFKAEPWQISWYLQDKMEWEGLVINAGLRLDMWHLGSDYEVLNEFNQFEKTDLQTDEQLHYILSPRIGISHTISSEDVLHFAFNRQSQLPQLQYVYPTASWFEQNTGINDHQVLLISNPELDPQVTITGEIGLQHQFNDYYSADVTIFYKKNYNYVSIEKTVVPDQNVLEYYQYISDNYGTSKGVDLNVQKMLSNFFVGSLAYSLSWSEGTDARIYDYLRQDQKIFREFPMDWDARHNLALNVAFEVQRNEELNIPFTEFKIPVHDFSINFLYNFASGTPYTDKRDENYEINEKRKPYTDVAQLTFTKNFAINSYSRLQMYCTIQNLFDKKNVDFSYIKSGSPYYDGEDSPDPNSSFSFEETKHIHDLYAKNPDNVSFGRRIFIGLNVSF